MKTVLLAGGFGTRLSEETSLRPKPMVEIGGKPILVHIMNMYAQHGIKDFVVAGGYKVEFIKNYFANFSLQNQDYIVDLKTGKIDRETESDLDWRVGLYDTGLNTMTGGRLKRLGKYLKDGTFMMTYGDGVSDIDIGALIDFHKSHGKLATITAVRPPARFGNLIMDGDLVERFEEKKPSSVGWINGGFFVLEPGVLDYLDGDHQPFEQEPLARLAADGELMAYRHDGFWQPMDTLREKNLLEDLWNSGEAPWSASAAQKNND